MGSSLLKINKIAVYHIKQGGGGGCHSQPVELVCSQGEGISDLSREKVLRGVMAVGIMMHRLIWCTYLTEPMIDEEGSLTQAPTC